MYVDTYDGWESCECGWREEQERRSESGSIFTHAAHVAATWREVEQDERQTEMAAIAEWQNSARIVIDAANQFVLDCVTGDGNPVTIAQALIDSGFDDGKTLR